MITKSTKIALSSLIGVIFLVSVITVGCKDKKKAEEAPAPAPTEVKGTAPSAADSIPGGDSAHPKGIDPPKPVN
jgi:hypothetical protein